MRIAFVGEAPGYEEMEEGRPFVGPSGNILWNFAARYANLQRSDVDVLNWSDVPLTKEMKKVLEGDEGWRQGNDAVLVDRLHALGIDVAAALGGYAVEALLGNDHSLFWSNGVAIERPGDGIVVVPVVHPAAGLHESTMLEKTAHGLAGLRRYLDTGEMLPAGWQTRQPGATRSWQGEWEGGPVAIDTEGSKEEPLCLTFSFNGQIAYIIYANEKRKLEAFKRTLRGPILLHNAMWDAGVLRKMGIEVWEHEVVDTMVLAYNLQNIPRGLKELTRSLLGFPMRDYDDVVRPYAEKALAKWRAKVYEKAVAGTDYVQEFTPKGKPRKKGGQDVYRLEGPEINLDIMRHVSRDQQLSLREEEWGKAAAGPKPGMDLRYVPKAEREEYAGKDALVTRRLYPVLQKRIEQDALLDVARLDMAALPLIEEMQATGLHIDLDRYWEVTGEISARKQQVITETREIVGSFDFNPGSPDQLREYAVRKGLQLGRPTPTGKASTEDNALEMLRESDPLIPLILEYRELDKYEGTYLLPVGQLIRPAPDGWRLYAELRATTVVSGRLSAHNPNVLAWPARTKLGLKLRSIFTAPAGKVLASWDLSQIELRLAAAFSGDPIMTEAFVTGRDLHTNLASKIFGVAYELVDKYTQRYPAKTIHYGLLYGEGGAKLYEELRGAGITAFSRDDCYRLLRETWEIYRVAGEYLRSKAAEAKRKGYVTDFLGRRRYLPGAHLVEEEGRWDTYQIKGLRMESERQAGNFAIQAAASEILKRAMVRVRSMSPELKRAGLRLWLQIHDELMGEVDEDKFERVNPLIKEAMTADSPLLAPIMIETEGVAGPSWGELKG